MATKQCPLTHLAFHEVVGHAHLGGGDIRSKVDTNTSEGHGKGEKNLPEGKVSDSCQGGNVHLVVVIDGLSLLGDQRAHSYG